MPENEIMEENASVMPLASEMFQELKTRNKFLQILIYILVFALIATNVFHIYQWSQFDTVVVDSTDGHANYIQGENSGGIYNGTDSGTQTEEGQIEGN